MTEFLPEENKGTKFKEKYDITDWPTNKLLAFINHNINKISHRIEILLILIMFLLILNLLK